LCEECQPVHVVVLERLVLGVVLRAPCEPPHVVVGVAEVLDGGVNGEIFH